MFLGYVSEALGFLEQADLNSNDLTTETVYEAIFLDNDSLAYMENEYIRHENTTQEKYITSPADTEIHDKVDLKDATVHKESKQQFKELCAQCQGCISSSLTGHRKD